MPCTNGGRWRKGLETKGFRIVVPLLALALGTGGCLVTTSTFESKTREADTLRDALAATNKEKNVLEARNIAIQKRLSEEKETNEALASRNREQEEELRRIREELSRVTRKYEGTRITREELISELLEKEKATGKRIQDLSARVQALEAEGEDRMKEVAARDKTISELEKKAAVTPDLESLRRERDILLGRVERIQEERLLEARRRDQRFADLSRTFSVISPQITTAPIGPAMRVLVPDKILFRKGKQALTDEGMKVIGEVGRTASEFPAAAILIKAKEKPQADEISAILTKEHSLSPERVLASAGSRDGETELLMVIP